MRNIIGFYGMTHLGLVSALAAADKGYDVICFDENPVLISQLQNQNYPIEEPYFSELMIEYKNRFQFTEKLESLLKANLIYVSMDVPTDVNNHSDFSPIRNALENLRRGLRSGQVIVVLSQIEPGFMRDLDFPNHQLFYQIETLIFGEAVERATQPERLMVGCLDPNRDLPYFYRDFLQKFDCPIFKMSYESAELTKIAINIYLVSSVMTSNMLAELASSVGANWKDIIPTLRLDKRIGPSAYLNPGLGISGGNLERDMMAITRQAEKNYVPTDLVKAWLTGSTYYKNWVQRCLQKNVFSNNHQPGVAVLGLAYKANTHSIKNSPSIQFIKMLTENTAARVFVHDPMVKEKLIENIDYCDTVLKALKSADVLVIMTPWPEYSQLSIDLLSQMPGRIIIDPYHLLNHDELLAAGFRVYTLGNNYQDAVSSYA